MEPQLQRIHSYFDACGSGDAEAVASNFTDDATIYDTNHQPVSGAATIGRFWARIAAKWHGARWQVESALVDNDAAAIEWVMTGQQESEGQESEGQESEGQLRPFAVRGSEHYQFSGDLIAEIRQYWTFDADAPDTGLVDYPYGDPGRLGGEPVDGATGP